MTTIQNENDLLEYILNQSKSGQKAWFGFTQQKIVGMYLAYEIGKLHADKLTPLQIVTFVNELNNAVFENIAKRS